MFLIKSETLRFSVIMMLRRFWRMTSLNLRKNVIKKCFIEPLAVKKKSNVLNKKNACAVAKRLSSCRNSTCKRQRIRKLRISLLIIWLGLNPRSNGSLRRINGARKIWLASIWWNKFMRTVPRLSEPNRWRKMRKNGAYNMRNSSLRKRLLVFMLNRRKRRCATQSQRRITRLISWSKSMSVIASNVESSKRKCLKREQPNLPSLSILVVFKSKRTLMQPFSSNGNHKAAHSTELFPKDDI